MCGYFQVKASDLLNFELPFEISIQIQKITSKNVKQLLLTRLNCPANKVCQKIKENILGLLT